MWLISLGGLRKLPPFLPEPSQDQPRPALKPTTISFKELDKVEPGTHLLLTFYPDDLGHGTKLLWLLQHGVVTMSQEVSDIIARMSLAGAPGQPVRVTAHEAWSAVEFREQLEGHLKEIVMNVA